MKRFLAIVLALSLFMVLTGCDRSGGNSPTAISGDVARFETGNFSFNKSELPRYKIGFLYTDWTSVLGTQFMFAIQYLADAFGCEAVFGNISSGEEGVNNLESLLASGDVDGIISVGMDPARMEVAQKYGVPVVSACLFPSDQEIASVASYPGFLGGTIENDVWAGYHAMKGLYDAGCRAVTWSGLTLGMSKGHDDRAVGVNQFISEHPDMKLLASSYTLGQWAQDISTFAAVFPELDGMCFSAIGDNLFTALVNEGIYDGSVKISGPDVASMTGEGFQRGIQVWSCGGQYGTVMIGWALLYNYLIDGTIIIRNTSEPIFRPFLEIASLEQFNQYNSIISSSTPVYNAEEIAALIHYFNPNVTFDDYMRLANQYSLDDILSRRR